MLARHPILRVDSNMYNADSDLNKLDDHEIHLINCVNFKKNFTLNQKTTSVAAISFLESDLFRASLIACTEFRIISNRVRP